MFFAREKNIANVANAQITKKAIKERKEKRRNFTTRRVDFNTINNENSALGNAGETFALEWERKRLQDLCVSFNILDEVIHFSRRYGDGAGYDIISRRDDNFELLYIEVKTTKGNINTPFYMSENEKNFMDIYKNSAVIYRVYNYDIDTNLGEIEIITQELLERDYVFNPITYRVTKNIK